MVPVQTPDGLSARAGDASKEACTITEASKTMEVWARIMGSAILPQRRRDR
jgi:hypothetical protein